MDPESGLIYCVLSIGLCALGTQITGVSRLLLKAGIQRHEVATVLSSGGIRGLHSWLCPWLYNRTSLRPQIPPHLLFQPSPHTLSQALVSDMRLSTDSCLYITVPLGLCICCSLHLNSFLFTLAPGNPKFIQTDSTVTASEIPMILPLLLFCVLPVSTL